MKMFTVVEFFLLLLCLIFVVLTACYYGDLRDTQQLTGHNLTSLQTLKTNCEKSLPRDKQCQLFVVASAKGVNND